MAKELKKANKLFSKHWKKDLKQVPFLKHKEKSQLELMKAACYCFYLRGWCDGSETGRK